jgi:hypothetical protein
VYTKYMGTLGALCIYKHMGALGALCVYIHIGALGAPGVHKTHKFSRDC